MFHDLPHMFCFPFFLGNEDQHFEELQGPTCYVGKVKWESPFSPPRILTSALRRDPQTCPAVERAWGLGQRTACQK